MRIEKMNRRFTKYHLDGPWPFAAVMHRFSGPDLGDPHDHPWSFHSFVLSGGYTEEVFRPDGTSFFADHAPGSSHFVNASTIHRIVRLHDICWTLILPGPPERKSGFYQFREDGTYHRYWDKRKWTRCD